MSHTHDDRAELLVLKLFSEWTTIDGSSTRSSIGQSIGLRNRGLQVRLLSGAIEVSSTLQGAVAMSIRRKVSVVVALMLLVAGVASAGAQEQPVEASLVASVDAIAPGQEFWVGVRMKLKPHWH